MLTALTFLADLPIYETVKPYQIKGFPDVDDAVRTNVVRIKKDGISVENVRKSTRETEFEECGFRWLKHESKYAIKSDDFEARSDDNPFVLGYLQETMDLIRAELGAKAVFCFDWRIRRNVDSIIDQFEDQDVAYSRHYVAPPVSIVHMDFSKQGGHDRIRAHFTENEYREIEQNHARILMINVWRPFQVVRDAPLALCDRRSVQTNDALEIDEVLPTHVEMEAFVKYRKHHEWYWLADQKPDEPAMFITWDSTSDRVDGGGVPHAACMDVLAEAGQQARESIEVRTMVML